LFPSKENTLKFRELVAIVPAYADMKVSRKQEEDAVRTTLRMGKKMCLGKQHPGESCIEMFFLGGTARTTGRTIDRTECFPGVSGGFYLMFHHLSYLFGYYMIEKHRITFSVSQFRKSNFMVKHFSGFVAI
jgi:hypothetical protein